MNEKLRKLLSKVLNALDFFIEVGSICVVFGVVVAVPTNYILIDGLRLASYTCSLPFLLWLPATILTFSLVFIPLLLLNCIILTALFKWLETNQFSSCVAKRCRGL